MKPQDDTSFRAWRAACIEESREVNLTADDLFGVLPFRRAALLLSKKLGLTLTCDVLERNLYFRNA